MKKIIISISIVVLIFFLGIVVIQNTKVNLDESKQTMQEKMDNTIEKSNVNNKSNDEVQEVDSNGKKIFRDENGQIIKLCYVRDVEKGILQGLDGDYFQVDKSYLKGMKKDDEVMLSFDSSEEGADGIYEVEGANVRKTQFTIIDTEVPK